MLAFTIVEIVPKPVGFGVVAVLAAAAWGSCAAASKLNSLSDEALELQAKLLCVIQSKQFQKVGSSKTVSVDVRVVAATNHE